MHTLGIDLGTTNTVVADHTGPLRLVDAGSSEHHALPSVVAFSPQGEVLVGETARQRTLIDPRNTIVSSKRVIGESWHSYRVQEYLRNYAVDLVEDGERVAFKVRAGFCTPVAAATHILNGFCDHAQRSPDGVASVVSVPVAFEARCREATKEAVLRAGFGDVHCIEEPVATALCYLERAQLRYGAVYDLGGGTFDLAIVDCSQFPPRVVGRAGDAYLGGDDMDLAIATLIRAQALREHGWDAAADKSSWARLVMLCEQAKCALSTTEIQTIDLQAADPAAPDDLPAVTLDRATLWELAQPLVQRTFALCDEALSLAGVSPQQVDAVFLAGGACRMAPLRDAVGSYFGRRPRFDLDPMYVVAMGANRAAARPGLIDLLK